MVDPCLIVGGDSAIGRCLGRYWEEQGVKFHASTRRIGAVSEERPYIDLDHAIWNSIQQTSYKSVVFCAAITGLANCENNQSLSYRVNVGNTLKLVEILSGNVEYLLFLSTSQVFDGSRLPRKISEPLNPSSEYGRQKAEVEVGLRSFPNIGILRLGKVIHDEWPLLEVWRNRLLAGEIIEAYSDVIFSPVKVEDVVLKIDQVVRAQESSIFHFSTSEDISYFEFAKDVSRQLGVDPGLVRGVLYKKDAD